MNQIYMVEWDDGGEGDGYYVKLSPLERKAVQKLMRRYEAEGKISNLKIWPITERANSKKEFIDTVRDMFER